MNTTNNGVNNNIKYNQLPDTLKRAIDERINTNSCIIKIRHEIKQLTKNYKFAKAAVYQQKLDEMVNRMVKDIVQEYQDETTSIEETFGSKETYEKACEIFVTIYFLTDMIETSLMELEEFRSRRLSEYKCNIGKDLLSTLKLSKTKMHKFSKNFPFFQYEEWGDEVDSLYDKVVKRAGIFTRKVMKSEKKKEQNINKNN